MLRNVGQQYSFARDRLPEPRIDAVPVAETRIAASRRSTRSPLYAPSRGQLLCLRVERLSAQQFAPPVEPESIAAWAGIAPERPQACDASRAALGRL
jgi:hypothetical protein